MCRLLLLGLALTCVMEPIYAQDRKSSDREQFVVVPSDQGLALIVPQPDSPLKFEDPKLVTKIGAPWMKSFKLRNTGTKPIRAFTVAAAASGEWGWQAPDPSQNLMPGELAPLGDNNYEIVPITEELRDKLKLRGPMKGIVALIVVRVEYADGSVFHEPAYNSLKEYFERIYLLKLK